MKRKDLFNIQGIATTFWSLLILLFFSIREPPGNGPTYQNNLTEEDLWLEGISLSDDQKEKFSTIQDSIRLNKVTKETLKNINQLISAVAPQKSAVLYTLRIQIRNRLGKRIKKNDGDVKDTKQIIYSAGFDPDLRHKINRVLRNLGIKIG